MNYVKKLNVGRVADIAVYISSTFGLLASVFLAIVEAISFPDQLSGFAAILARITVIAALPVSMAFIARLQVLEYDKTPRQVEKEGISGCPRWMRVSANISIAVGVILFLLPILLETLHYLPASDREFFPETSSGGVGMVVYAAIISQLYSANALARGRIPK